MPIGCRSGRGPRWGHYKDGHWLQGWQSPKLRPLQICSLFFESFLVINFHPHKPTRRPLLCYINWEKYLLRLTEYHINSYTKSNTPFPIPRCYLWLNPAVVDVPTRYQATSIKSEIGNFMISMKYYIAKRRRRYFISWNIQKKRNDKIRKRSKE